jgi:hypothetical protein
VASKQQTTALFLFTTVTRTRRTEKKNWRTWWGNPCCAREHSVQFFVQYFLIQFNCTVQLRVCGALWNARQLEDRPIAFTLGKIWCGTIHLLKLISYYLCPIWHCFDKLCRPRA